MSAALPFAPALRPPGAVRERDFAVRCIRCGRCVEICPHDTLFFRGGFGRDRHTPMFDPKKKPCLLCMKCPPVCPSGALDATLTDMRRAHMGRAYILRNACHNYTGATMCMTCYDRCPLRASAVVLVDGLTPAITSACVGCGVCAHVCPVGAVVVLPREARWIPGDAVPTRPAEGESMPPYHGGEKE